MAKKYMTPLKVRNYHLDGYGHVNNAKYLNLLEEARTQFMESVGCPLEGYYNQGICIFISEINIKYKKPAILGNHLEVFTWFSVMKRAQMKFRQEIRLAESTTIITTAEVSCGWIKNGKVIPIPDDFQQIMNNYYIYE